METKRKLFSMLDYGIYPFLVFIGIGVFMGVAAPVVSDVWISMLLGALFFLAMYCALSVLVFFLLRRNN